MYIELSIIIFVSSCSDVLLSASCSTTLELLSSTIAVTTRECLFSLLSAIEALAIRVVHSLISCPACLAALDGILRLVLQVSAGGRLLN
jgi:hypothetical protein